MSEKAKSYQRFSVAQRIEHIVLILSFSILGLTGLPQKYPLSPISIGVIDGLGGIETIRIIHRIAATIFLVQSIYHLVVVGYKLYVQRKQASMVPTVKDGVDAVQAFMHNLGLRDESPKMPRYNFAEKAEYWAMLWGLFVMAVTGFMLWNPIATTNLLPGEFVPAAKVAHGGEAVLAVLAIILWHFYNVHLKLFNTSMFTGKLDRHVMEEEHGQELEQLEAGHVYQQVDPASQRKRMALFVPAASVLSVILLAGVVYFVTFEESSISTIPPAQFAQVFVTQTPTPVPPTPTPEPTQPPQAGGAAVGWNGDLDSLFKAKCGTCHGTAGGFSAGTYSDVLKSIEPGDADGSPLVEVQKSGHPGNFNSAELNRVIEWIEAGAPEEGGTASEAGGSSQPLVWTDNIETMFVSQCKACHGTIGGFTATTYEDAMKAIEPGNPDGSSVVVVQKKGNHPGMFKPAQLQAVIDWIAAGAPK